MSSAQHTTNSCAMLFGRFVALLGVALGARKNTALFETTSEATSHDATKTTLVDTPGDILLETDSESEVKADADSDDHGVLLR